MGYSRFGSSIVQEFAIRSFAELCGAPAGAVVSRKLQPLLNQELSIVTGNASDAEAISTCQVLCHVAQQRTETSSEKGFVESAGAPRCWRRYKRSGRLRD